MFKISLLLLLVEANFIRKKQSYKKDAFVAFSFSNFKIAIALLTDVKTLYI